MTRIKDFKGNSYAVLEIRKNNTLLRCEKTGEHTILRNNGWSELGFIKP